MQKLCVVYIPCVDAKTPQRARRLAACSAAVLLSPLYERFGLAVTVTVCVNET